MGFVPDLSTMKRHTGFVFFFAGGRGELLLFFKKRVLLNNMSRGLHSLPGPHTEVTEPSELAECGNQNRRACLMPGGREEGWTNTISLIFCP